MEDSGTEEVILYTSTDVDVICMSSQMFSSIFYYRRNGMQKSFINATHFQVVEDTKLGV